MTLPADKLDAFLAGVLRMEAMVTSMGDSLGRIEADLAALSRSMPRISRTVPLLWFALAAAVVVLAVSVVG